MKFLKLNIFLILTLLFTACSNDDDTPIVTPDNETADLTLLTTFENATHNLEIYSKAEALKVGYNQIYFRLTDKNQQPKTDINFTWTPTMSMMMNGNTHQHSTPYSAITKVKGKSTLYTGSIVFIMPSSDMDTWTLEFTYTSNGQTYTVSDDVEVISSTSTYHKSLISTTGNDDQQYILALVQPEQPIIGVNPMQVALYKSINHGMDFKQVEGFTLLVDPRMPAMGYHSAPGNEALTQGTDGFYHGKVGFSMSGYWEVNLVMKSADGTVVKGEPFSEDQPASSLQFKIEF